LPRRYRGFYQEAVSSGFFVAYDDRTGRVSNGLEWAATKKTPHTGDTHGNVTELG